MATKSPIRMCETRGKWAFHERASTFPQSSNMSVDEGALLMSGQGHKYHKGRGMILYRSGSAPPNMESSLAAIDSLTLESGFNASIANLHYDRQFGDQGGALVSNLSVVSDCSSGVGLGSRSCYSFSSGFEHSVSSRAGNQLRLTPFSGSSDNFLQLYQSSLSTHKEESEDDRSPQKVSDELMNKSSVVWSGQESSSVGHARNVAESIKDEFTCMSSPTNDKPKTVCHGSGGDGSNDHEQSTSLSTEVASSTRVDDTSLASQGDQSASIFRPSSGDSRQGSSHSIQIDDSSNISLNSENNTLASGDQDITYLQTGITALNLAGTPKVEKNDARGERPHTSFVQHQMHQPIVTLQYQSSVPQIVSHVIPNQVLHGGKFSSTEAQSVLHSSGFTPPLYATAAASYMHSANPYYSGVQQSGVVYPPQYGIGGYPYNPGVVPSYLGGYPTHNAVPLAFDGSTTAVSDVNTHGTWGSSSQGVDMQHMNRFYGQLGFAPPVVDPRLQFQPPYGDFYNVPGQIDPLASRGGVMENQVSGYDPQIVSDFGSAPPDYRPQNQGVGGQDNLSQPRGAFSGIDYTASSTNTGFFTHITNSALASPVLPGSPIGGTGTGFPGVRSVGSPHSGRSTSPYGSWHGHRGFENFNHPKPFSYLEELKSGKGRRFELSDIVGHVVDFSVDQHGSRFIQQKLENCSVEDKQSVFQEVLPHASKLMSDVFGNYVIQKFFEYGTPDQRRDLAYALKGQILQLSLQMYGCRVIQKALDVIEVEQKTELVHELDGHVMRCVRDQNGNHVIQKCIECIPSERIGFIISSFRDQVASLSMHPYGCRVIQRILERCSTELETQFIVDEILESVCTLAQDQYGNYVTQHVLEKGKADERLQIIKNLSGKVVQMSQHKFASNVIEKCLEYGDPAGRELLIGEVIGQNDGNDNLLVMMKDQYANYVVQKILETCTDSQRDLLIGRISVHLHGLKKYTYGKHIVSRFEKLFGEMQAPAS